MTGCRLLGTLGVGLALGWLPGWAAAQAVPPTPPVTAAAQGIGLKVTGGLHALSGDDFGTPGLDLRNGFGAEAVVSHGWAGGLELGLGVGIGFHEPRALGADPSGDLVTVFVEPLYRFGVAAERRMALYPFVGARLGWARLNLDPGDPNGDDLTANGFQGGALGGLELWLTDEVGLVGSVGFDFLSFGDLDNGFQLTENGPDGGRLGVQGGLKVRFP